MKVDPGRILLVVLLFTAALAAAILALRLLEAERTTTIVIGAGSKSGESFAVATAIADMAELYEPHLDIVVAESAGSSENLRLLSEGLIEAATLQADSKVDARLRLVTELYPDAYQILARRDAGIRRVSDLRGKRVAVPGAGSGQTRSFLGVAAHYGVGEAEMELVPMTEGARRFAILRGEVDATFAVRAAGNAALQDLIELGDLVMVPIDQAEALQLRLPGVRAGRVPRGSYRGAPALPEQDLETAVVSRLLVSSETVDAETVESLTRLIYEHRQELSERVPLLGFLADPSDLMSSAVPLHDGARAYYTRDEPTFLQENVEVLAFYTTLMIGVVSMLLQINARRQKSRADSYNRRIVELYNQVIDDPDPNPLAYRNASMEIFGEVVRDTEAGLISSNGFEFLQFTWDEINDAIQEVLQIKGRAPGDVVAGETTR